MALPIAADADHANGLRHCDAVGYHDPNHGSGHDHAETYRSRRSRHDAKLLHDNVADE